jgi:drug/metabolite transporter (DMT)-like permease
MNLRTQRLAVWTGPLTCLLFAVGLIGLAQFVPPPHTDASLDEVVSLYADHTERLRAGLVLMMIGAGFIASWGSAITTQLKRIEGAHSPMTWTNLACTAANVMVVTVPVMIMIAASFRPDRNPEITQALNDLAWIMFVMVFPPVMVQELAIAAAVFAHPGQKVFPRWVGYFNVWCALLLVPAVLLPFFKTGPFAWHGILEFWLAGVVFFGWIVVMTVATIGAINRQAAQEPATAPVG